MNIIILLNIIYYLRNAFITRSSLFLRHIFSNKTNIRTKKKLEYEYYDVTYFQTSNSCQLSSL